MQVLLNGRMVSNAFCYLYKITLYQARIHKNDLCDISTDARYHRMHKNFPICFSPLKPRTQLPTTTSNSHIPHIIPQRKMIFVLTFFHGLTFDVHRSYTQICIMNQCWLDQNPYSLISMYFLLFPYAYSPNILILDTQGSPVSIQNAYARNNHHVNSYSNPSRMFRFRYMYHHL